MVCIFCFINSQQLRWFIQIKPQTAGWLCASFYLFNQVHHLVLFCFSPPALRYTASSNLSLFLHVNAISICTFDGSLFCFSHFAAATHQLRASVPVRVRRCRYMDVINARLSLQTHSLNDILRLTSWQLLCSVKQLAEYCKPKNKKLKRLHKLHPTVTIMMWCYRKVEGDLKVIRANCCQNS